ncbi:hypothetical protein CONPUDRAFT_147226 [Coniophora puteana RWD-64-598 SS2]|uniref:Uncharacterized protein n=1 Tax=Coniophora puteana (strain RWD-64-598) TaxID=741705 RepID=A0A5M3MAP8_CONPW|nr:uncharacterized protein CONPUDRAFT_147226 [Coniophora puteana RWD-64-598 SS2]EIW75695.1 hypothetical protein CONPUDRAFT_147226 [Coniophora puteana RWD-64-598 SS2]
MRSFAALALAVTLAATLAAAVPLPQPRVVPVSGQLTGSPSGFNLGARQIQPPVQPLKSTPAAPVANIVNGILGGTGVSLPGLRRSSDSDDAEPISERSLLAGIFSGSANVHPSRRADQSDVDSDSEGISERGLLGGLFGGSAGLVGGNAHVQGLRLRRSSDSNDAGSIEERGLLDGILGGVHVGGVRRAPGLLDELARGGVSGST